jgi:hypothetical protein
MILYDCPLYQQQKWRQRSGIDLATKTTLRFDEAAVITCVAELEIESAALPGGCKETRRPKFGGQLITSVERWGRPIWRLEPPLRN